MVALLSDIEVWVLVTVIAVAPIAAFSCSGLSSNPASSRSTTGRGIIDRVVVVDVTLPLFFPPEGKPFGWQDPAQWDTFSAWMKKNDLLENPPDPAAAHDNTLLPGAGL